MVWVIWVGGRVANPDLPVIGVNRLETLIAVVMAGEDDINLIFLKELAEVHGNIRVFNEAVVAAAVLPAVTVSRFVQHGEDMCDIRVTRRGHEVVFDSGVLSAAAVIIRPAFS